MPSKNENAYSTQDIEVLENLDPVKRRPGMYTDTTNPNHLAREAIDNSVDEATAGHAKRIDVILYKDGSIEVIDDGRGMPIDMHPQYKVSGMELILSKLHAGAKFSNKSYQFSGGLHGVGISVVNALSTKLIATVKRDGKIYQMQFADGKRTQDLKTIGTCGPRETGTSVHFWPDAQYFDSPKFSVPALLSNLRAKAVLCPGLFISFKNEFTNETQEWCYENGLVEYLNDHIGSAQHLPAEPFTGSFKEKMQALDWAIVWLSEEKAELAESYVNLIPTPQGGTHVNGLRTGLLDAVREFCEIQNLLPRGLKLTADDVWEGCSYVLSVKLNDPQFAGQTKERLSSRECTNYVANTVKDALSLWLNQHVQPATELVALFIRNAQERLRLDKQVLRKKVASGPALPGKLADCVSGNPLNCELFLVEGDSAGGSAKQARDKNFQAIMPLRGKILNTWEVDSREVLASQEVHDIAVAVGVDPDSNDLSGLRYGRICILADADSDGNHIATLLCALFLKHFKPLVAAGNIYVAMPPLYRIDLGKEVFYALDEKEKEKILNEIAQTSARANPQIQRFKGLGEMNPIQLRETTMDPQTRRLVQLTLTEAEASQNIMDMMLAKKRAKDRRDWLESKGNLAAVL